MYNVEYTTKFIELYHKHPVLWDTKRRDYSNKEKRTEAVENIGKIMDMTKAEVKTKIKNLRSYYCREHYRVQKKREIYKNYQSNWFAYEKLFFIMDTVRDKYKTIKPAAPETEDHVSFSESDEPAEESLNMDIKVEPCEKVYETPESSVNNNRGQKRPADEEDEFEFVNCPAEEVQKDECTIFAELIACQLKKLSKVNQAIARHQINNILFKLEMDELNCPVHLKETSTTISPSNTS